MGGGRMKVRYLILASFLISISFMGILSYENTQAALAFEEDILINNDGSDFPQGDPDITADGRNIFIVWQDRRNGKDWDIYFRSSDDGGFNFGPEVRVDDTDITPTLTDDETDQITPKIAVDPDGVIHVIWSDNREGRPLIYYSKSTDNGMNFTSNVRISSSFTGSQTNPHLDISPSGKIFAVWEDTRLAVDHEQIYGSITDSTGKFTDSIRISDTRTDHYCFNPRIAFSDDTNIHVVWTEDRVIDVDIVISSSADGGATFLPSFIMNRDPTSSDQDLSDIDANSTAVVVVWTDSRMSSSDIFVTISNDKAKTFPLEQTAHPNASSGHQYQPEVSIEEDGNISICWTSSPGFSDQRSDIQMTRLLTNGTYDEVETVNDPGQGVTQDSPAMCVEGGRAHIVWRDYRSNSQADIFYSRTAQSGEEGEAPELSGIEINPPMGGLGQKFTFKVIYSDVENDPPVSGYPKLDLYYKSVGGLLFPYPGNFNMTRLMVPPPNFDYRDGETYIITVTPTRQLELYYSFRAKASSGNSTEVSTPLTKGPMLDFTGPTFDRVKPSDEQWQKDNIVDFEMEICDDLSGVDPWSISYQRFNLATEKWDSWQRKGTVETIDNHTVSYKVSITLFEGKENQVRFRSKDIVGNGEDENGYSLSETYNIWVDPIGPNFNIISPRSGQKLKNTEVSILISVWDEGAGLDTESLNISYSLGGPDNYGEWVPVKQYGANISEDIENEGRYILRMNLSRAYGYNNFFRVSAKDLLGNERISQGVQVVIEKEVVVITDRPPLAVSSIQPKVSGSVKPHITWTPTYDPDGDLVSYWLRIEDITENEPVLEWEYLGPGATYWDPDVDTSFIPGHTYLIEVIPEANGLNGTATNSTLLISNDANMPPDQVVGLVPRATSDPSPTLRWDASTDPEGDTVIYFIRIGTFYNGGNILEWATTFTETKYKIDRTLGAGTYHVQIMCSDGTDFSPVAHFTVSIGIYSPEIDSERTSIVIYPPKNEIDSEIEKKYEHVELTVINKGFTFDNIRIRLDGEATLRDDMEVYVGKDLLEISPGSSMNTSLTVVINENTKFGLYTLNLTVISLDGVSTYSKALSIRIVDPTDIPTGPNEDNGDDGVEDTQILLWLFFGLLLIILIAMGYAYYRIDRKQREEEVEILRKREASMLEAKKSRELKEDKKKELRGRKKDRAGLPSGDGPDSK
jgi:hypothetical protein